MTKPITLIEPSAEKLDLPLLSATTLHRGGDWVDVVVALILACLMVPAGLVFLAPCR